MMNTMNKVLTECMFPKITMLALDEIIIKVCWRNGRMKSSTKMEEGCK